MVCPSTFGQDILLIVVMVVIIIGIIGYALKETFKG